MSLLPVSKGFRPFEDQTIRQQLSGESQSLLQRLTLLDVVDSTSLLLQRLPATERHAHAVVADQQNSGRGRRGREWHSPGGCNIHLSLGWAFHLPAGSLTRLPLAVAVMVSRAVQRAGLTSIGIKWPNDIQVDGRKLAGVLVELSSNGADQALAVMGVGVNVRMPEEEPGTVAIDQPWTDLCSHVGQIELGSLRDRLCGMLLDELLRGVAQFSREDFQPFKKEWNSLDVLKGREVTVSDGAGSYTGKANGISESGGLLIDCLGPDGKTQVQECFAADVSVRPIAD